MTQVKKLEEMLDLHDIVPYIRAAGYAVRRPFKLGERRLLDYVFLYVQEGRMLITAEQKEYALGPGDCAFLQPNDLHTIEGMTNTVSPYVHMDIFYHINRADSFVSLPGQTDMERYSHLIQPRLGNCVDVDVQVDYKASQPLVFRNTLNKLIDCWNRGNRAAKLEATQYAYELILPILKESLVSGSDALVLEPMIGITTYMQYHMSERLSVKDMASKSGMSESRFTTLFREQFDTSPYQYLLKLRIEHAEELLKKTSLEIQQISEYCGFSDIYQFTKMFRKATGYPPGAYRKSSLLK